MQIQSNGVGVFTENNFPCCHGLCCRIKLATLIHSEMMAPMKHEMVVFTWAPSKFQSKKLFVYEVLKSFKDSVAERNSFF